MYVHMIDAAAIKELGKVQGIAGALFCLGLEPIFAVVLLNEITRPFAGSVRLALEDLQNLLRRRVVDGRAQSGDMFVAQAGERRINRADHKLDPAPFESEHFRIAKRLRDYRVTRIEITEPHQNR
jgi:hypothetical protein